MSFLANLDQSVLVVIDQQESFRKAIPNFDAITSRIQFLMECAKVLSVPVVVTEQNPEKLGNTAAELDLTDIRVFEKMTFSAVWNAEFVSAISQMKRRQLILCGIETHICVTQTAHHLVEMGLQVGIVLDAIGARHSLGHESGIRRLSAIGCALTHSESVVYEWMQGADHERFRDVLRIVKAFPV